MAGWLAFVSLRTTWDDKLYQQAETEMAQLALQLRSDLRTAQANVGLFAKSGVLERYIQTSSQAGRYALMQPTLLRLLSSYQQAYPDYYEIRVLLPDGHEDARVTQLPLFNATEDEGDTPYFRAMRDSARDTFATFFDNPDNAEFALLAAHKIKLRDPTLDPISDPPALHGYLVITSTLQSLAKQLREYANDKGLAFFFTDDTGVVVLHTDATQIKTKLPAELFAQLVQIAPSQRLSAGYRGEPAVFMGKPLHPKLYAFAQVPVKELTASTRKLAWLVAAVTIMTIVITVALVLVGLRYLLVNRIQLLNKAAREIGAGGLVIAGGSQAGDELGQLDNSLKQMTRSLEDTHEKNHYLAYHDALTGLPNRLMFNNCLQQALARATQHGEQAALLFLDVDNFKQVNDSLGHHAGDALLRQFAERIVQCLRAECGATSHHTSELVARLGGDEFIVLLPVIHDSADASRIARRLLESLAAPFIAFNHDFYVTASIGIALFPRHGTEADVLTRNADIAMYQAKKFGKNGCQMYTENMSAVALDRFTLGNRLRKAMDNMDFDLYYQPQVDIKTGAVVGLEALLRWRGDAIGTLSPQQFIPFAEDSGQILTLGRWVVYQACAQIKQWREGGVSVVPISVNISSVQLQQEGLAAMIGDALKTTGATAECLDIELTETAIMAVPDRCVQILEEIKSAGVSISLDDFGTGYSSLSYLKKFPIDRLKIDGSFIHGIGSEPDSAIVAAVIAMARSLNLNVVAECVETTAQLDFLRWHDCDSAQGHLLGMPLPAAAIPNLLRDGIVWPGASESVRAREMKKK